MAFISCLKVTDSDSCRGLVEVKEDQAYLHAIKPMTRAYGDQV
jgi:hypothetical protein